MLCQFLPYRRGSKGESSHKTSKFIWKQCYRLKWDFENKSVKFSRRFLINKISGRAAKAAPYDTICIAIHFYMSFSSLEYHMIAQETHIHRDAGKEKQAGGK